jgi:hypothetical protein
MIRIVAHDKDGKHVAHDVAEEFESAILEDKNVVLAPITAFTNAVNSIYPYLYRYGFPIPKLPFNLLRGDYLVVFMSTWDFNEAMPYFMAEGRKYAYIFDAWSQVHENIIKFVNKWNIDHVFVSSNQAATMLNDYGTRCEFHWIPEGIDYRTYRFYSYAEKDIDVLQMGRKFDKYHKAIAGHLEYNDIRYLYEKVKGEVIFPEHEDFINGLARTKISICFPSNITHPERAGEIETLTNRYLQSMASKCLIVGHAPNELIELFGYNPVIEVDMKNPAHQIEAILKNFQQYIPIIEKNYNGLKEHTWPKRWKRMSEIISRNKIIRMNDDSQDGYKRGNNLLRKAGLY